MNKYIYADSDFSEKKNLYMYSNENWNTFLETYTKNRKNIYSEIKNKIIPAAKKRRDHLPEFSAEFNTLKVIDSLLSASSLERNNVLYLNFLLKKLESTKIIIKEYPKGQDPEEININYYIKLSYLFSAYTEEYGDIRFINILLKLNDKLINHKAKWIGGESEAYIFHSLCREVQIVKQLTSRAI